MNYFVGFYLLNVSGNRTLSRVVIISLVLIDLWLGELVTVLYLISVA